MVRIFCSQDQRNYKAQDCHCVNQKTQSCLFQVDFTKFFFCLFYTFRFETGFRKACRFLKTIFFIGYSNINANLTCVIHWLFLFDVHFFIVFSIDCVVYISVWLIICAEILTGPWLFLGWILELDPHRWFFIAIILFHQLL